MVKNWKQYNESMEENEVSGRTLGSEIVLDDLDILKSDIEMALKQFLSNDILYSGKDRYLKPVPLKIEFSKKSTPELIKASINFSSVYIFLVIENGEIVAKGGEDYNTTMVRIGDTNPYFFSKSGGRFSIDTIQDLAGVLEQLYNEAHRGMKSYGDGFAKYLNQGGRVWD